MTNVVDIIAGQPLNIVTACSGEVVATGQPLTVSAVNGRSDLVGQPILLSNNSSVSFAVDGTVTYDDTSAVEIAESIVSQTSIAIEMTDGVDTIVRQVSIQVFAIQTF